MQAICCNIARRLKEPRRLSSLLYAEIVHRMIYMKIGIFQRVIAARDISKYNLQLP